MGDVQDTIARIKWRSVLALLVVIIVLFFLVTSINPLTTGYSVRNNIGLKTDVKPSSIMPGDISTIRVELMNLNKEKTVTLGIKAKTTDKNIFFTETYSGDYMRGGITIGPQETRKLKFDIKSKDGSLAGKYGIVISAVEDGKIEGSESTVFIDLDDGE